MGWLPFDEIIRSEIVESLYAADLWSVYTGRAPERYQNPDQFFQRTYFTSSLRNFLSELARRLDGDPNVNPVILTGLGGGKTHTPIAAFILRYGLVDKHLN
jgi:predicted AAA+ superfamily ATPase